jgi:hypothetical protein
MSVFYITQALSIFKLQSLGPKICVNQNKLIHKFDNAVLTKQASLLSGGKTAS